MLAGINFNKEIDADSITWLMEQINFYDAPVNIYLNSGGGDPFATPSLIHFINQVHKEKNITLIGTFTVSSAAFDILWQTNCKKDLTPGTWATIHKTNLQADTNTENDKSFLEQKKVVREQDEALYQFLKKSKIISANDLKNYNQNKNVVIGYEKLKKLLGIDVGGG